MIMTDPADLFCALYDALDDRAVGSDRRWERSDYLAALTAEVKARALDLTLDERWLHRRAADVQAASGEDDAALTWAAARGLDRAFQDGTPLYTSAPTPGGDVHPLTLRLKSRYTAYGRLDTGRAGGALLPKLVGAGRTGETTATRVEAFASVQRVARDIWDSELVDFARVRAKHEPRPRARQERRGLVVACVPLLASMSEIHFEPLETEEGNFFAARPHVTEEYVERIRTVLRRLDDAGAMLGVCPELALSQEVLETWREAVRTTRRPPGGALEWVFVGSGPLAGCEPPCNTGVVLHRVTGQVVHAQEKLFPFTLKPDQIADWGLEDYFSSQSEEYMTRGTKLLIRESDWGRVAILICEDLAKVLEEGVGRLLRGFGASLLIAPVFSKEVLSYRWEHTNARIYAQQVGTPAVVANSLAIPRRTRPRGDVGTCLVNAGGSYEIGLSRAADQISVFWMTSDAVQVPATHPVATDPA